MVGGIGSVGGLAGAGTLMRPGAERRITPLTNYRHSETSRPTRLPRPAAPLRRQLFVLDPGQGEASIHLSEWKVRSWEDRCGPLSVAS
jgi:hypothetical protein